MIIIFVLWYYFDVCRIYKWVPYVDIIVGLILTGWLYRQRWNLRQEKAEKLKKK